MAWFILIVAGLLEVGWSLGLKLSEGFSRPLVTVFTILAIIASMFLLGIAARELPIGTAYAVWVGIGAAGAAIGGIFLFGEAVSAGRLFFLGMLLLSIVGLKATSGA